MLRKDGRNIDYNRPKSVYNFYAYFATLWITPINPHFNGLLPPNPVDNRVENVDFPRAR